MLHAETTTPSSVLILPVTIRHKLSAFVVMQAVYSILCHTSVSIGLLAIQQFKRVEQQLFTQGYNSQGPSREQDASGVSVAQALGISITIPYCGQSLQQASHRSQNSAILNFTEL